MNKIGKTFAVGGLLVYIFSEAIQDIQHPGDTDRERTNANLTDTGYVPETIRQETAYRRPAPEKPGLAQRPVSDTGDTTDTGQPCELQSSLDGCRLSVSEPQGLTPKPARL